jgi:hypothetical protein
MKYLKINLGSIKLKGDEEDLEQLQADLFERIISMCEAETLEWSIDEESEEDEDDF